MSNDNQMATDRLKSELHRALEDTRAGLDRVEIWSVGCALSAARSPSTSRRFSI